MVETDEEREFRLLGETIQSLPYHLLPPCKYEYKGGAKYYGEIVDFKRQGKGIMTYPDGDLYEGVFKEGVKEGQGTQKWLDGSIYQGSFVKGRRHGNGVHTWPSGESYEGEYAEDQRSGQGVYTWPSGDRFSGNFARDQKHGPGQFFFANGNIFKGEYVGDERCGRGVMKYRSQREDWGRWRGCSLLKLDMSVMPASLLDIADARPDCDMMDMREVTKGFQVKERPSEAAPKGALETASEALLLAAIKGDSAGAVYLLQHTCVRPDVADFNGITPLLASSVFCKTNVVNILLDNGADVNQLTDAGVSALVACHLHLYSNMQCGYEIKHRLAPLSPCSADEELEGPIEEFAALEESAKMVAEEEGEKKEKEEEEEEELEKEDDVEKEEEDEDEEVKRESYSPTSTMSEPEDKTSYTTVVVYGKRYFVLGKEVLKDLILPSSANLPTPDQLRETIKLLLKRGADPKIGTVPVPALILAVLARDVEAVDLLLQSGADPTAHLGPKYGHKSPLHVAAGLLGPGAPAIVALLLKAGADPNVQDSLSFSRSGTLQWKLVEEKNANGKRLGSTPLQVACSKDQDYPHSTEVIKLLLAHGADTNVICSGHSPLTLSIYSGNDPALELLLKSGANPSLYLGSPIGSALCAAVDTAAEHRRTNEQRLGIIDQLMAMGGDIMAQVPVGKSGKHTGTAVDYAMHVFYQDKRIAHTPFHALTPAEREIYMARTNLLNHMASLLREEVQQREAALRLEEQQLEGDGENKKGQKPKMLFKYCNECGRSAGVKLSPCTRCYTVSFCSQRCKLKAWTNRHRRECIKLENKRQERKEAKLPPVTTTKKLTKQEIAAAKREAQGKSTKRSVTKDIFGKGSKTGKEGEQEIISHALPRLVNLQHSQI